MNNDTSLEKYIDSSSVEQNHNLSCVEYLSMSLQNKLNIKTLKGYIEGEIWLKLNLATRIRLQKQINIAV